MAQGLIFHFPKDTSGLDMAVARALQKRLIHTWTRFVLHTDLAPDAADGPDIPDLTRQTALLDNLPLALTNPLADKLNALRLGLPVLLLLPGPSLNALAPVLGELACRCLVVCISKSLGWCLEQGVAPDFVVQLDTYLVQQRLYDHVPTLPDTVLVPLSAAPVHRYAHKFRGLCFMDSFDEDINPNPYRLRQNPVSSLLACLGLAECLHAPQCFLAGADLSSPGNGLYVDDRLAPSASRRFDPASPILTSTGRFILPDRNGNAVESLNYYIAAAHEAADFAQAIAATTGTRFHNLTDTGLLDAELFPKADMAAPLALPEIDRTALRARLAPALAAPQTLDLAALEDKLRLQILTLREAIFHLQSLRRSGDMDQARRHPFFMFAETEPDISAPREDDVLLEVALASGRRTLRSARLALSFTRARRLVESGAKVTLLCRPGEQDDMARRHGHLIPRESMQFKHIDNGHTAAESISARQLFAALLPLDAVVLSRHIREEYDYFFESYSGGNLIYFDPLYREQGNMGEQ